MTDRAYGPDNTSHKVVSYPLQGASLLIVTGLQVGAKQVVEQTQPIIQGI